jgi:CotS family spore coat protein
MDELFKIIKREYGINGNRLQPFHSVWKLTSPQGIFILKKMNCSSGQIDWVHGQLQQLIAAGFHGVTPFCLTADGAPAIRWKKTLFALTPWQPGSNPSFTNSNQIPRAAQFFGELHQAAKHCVPLRDYPDQNPLQALEDQTAFLKRTLHKLAAKSTGNRIDHAIRKWGQHFLAQADLSMARLTTLNYGFWSRTTPEKGFCHNDPAPGNLLIYNSQWRLIDFELSAAGVFCAELALLLHRMLLANQWDFRIWEPLLAAYTTARPLSQAETDFLPALLCFPRAFWRLLRQRYKVASGWSERRFQDRLWKLTTIEPFRVNFLRQWFPELVDRHEA